MVSNFMICIVNEGKSRTPLLLLFLHPLCGKNFLRGLGWYDNLVIP